MRCPDPELAGLLVDRETLLEELAHVLRRVGASHPDRAKVNARRAKQRKKLKKALRLNANAIAHRNVQLYAIDR